ncbi:hypothetical protein [Streptomyces sp. ITFR-6]|uniref:hypothetical protein n=1 Tax=Streptomyces sp. ITFR-6 TaxID=3075197 RepID=UPI00288925B9|nr:hypothetical protein [Streptomyces sp. ITFR-6]WNI28607.1 hypothetical protein RLT59_07275 [Streptomyces sp. ITFR-6]
MSDITVGDRVRVVREYENTPGRHAGAVGSVVSIDNRDDRFPYEVRTDGGVNGEGLWVHEVELLDSVSSAAADRESLVTRAKSLLAGTEHTGADVVAMAAFLAGGAA